MQQSDYVMQAMTHDVQNVARSQNVSVCFYENNNLLFINSSMEAVCTALHQFVLEDNEEF